MQNVNAKKVQFAVDMTGQTAPLALYRFLNGITSNDSEIVPEECNVEGARVLEISGDEVLETICFSECSACDPQGLPAPPAEPAELYPNPMKEASILAFHDDLWVHTVVISDLTGNTVRLYKDVPGPFLNILKEDLKNGLYFIRISNKNIWLNTLKLQVNN